MFRSLAAVTADYAQLHGHLRWQNARIIYTEELIASVFSKSKSAPSASSSMSARGRRFREASDVL